ncbi:hypothetical protein IWX76_001914 [Pedobacter sp. CAN_A7]
MQYIVLYKLLIIVYLIDLQQIIFNNHDLAYGMARNFGEITPYFFFYGNLYRSIPQCGLNYTSLKKQEVTHVLHRRHFYSI